MGFCFCWSYCLGYKTLGLASYKAAKMNAGFRRHRPTKQQARDTIMCSVSRMMGEVLMFMNILPRWGMIACVNLVSFLLSPFPETTKDKYVTVS